MKKGYQRTRLSSAVSRDKGEVWEHHQNIHSLHPEERVVCSEVKIMAPEEFYDERARGYEKKSQYWDKEHIVPLMSGWGSYSYPSMLALDDRVIIHHTYSYHNEYAKRIDKGFSRLKIFPVEWFYGCNKWDGGYGENTYYGGMLMDFVRSKEKRGMPIRFHPDG